MRIAKKGQIMYWVKKFTSFFPTKLPVGLAEFNEWADSIIELSGRFADEDSLKFAIANMVLHLGPQRSSAPKNYFVRSLRKTAANQVAGQVFLDIKEKQKAQQEAAKTAAQSNTAEAPALQEVSNAGVQRL